MPQRRLESIFGEADALWLSRLARGIDDAAVKSRMLPKSISCCAPCTTKMQDLNCGRRAGGACTSAEWKLIRHVEIACTCPSVCSLKHFVAFHASYTQTRLTGCSLFLKSRLVH